VRAYAPDPERSNEFLRALGFEPGWVARGDERSGAYVYDRAPEAAPIPGAGTVHHVAWASRIEDHGKWRERVAEAGGRPTPIIERFYFKSIYFREPNGILFEIATLGPGFTADEPLEHLGGRLSLPPAFEPLRAQVEPQLTPIRNPRESWTRT
jgi:glyoxalase family protein